MLPFIVVKSLNLKSKNPKCLKGCRLHTIILVCLMISGCTDSVEVTELELSYKYYVLDI